MGAPRSMVWRRQLTTAAVLAAALTLLQPAACIRARPGGARPDLRAACAAVQKDGAYGCVSKAADGSFGFTDSEAVDACVASGVYVDSALTPSNFGKLRLASSPLYSDADQMYAVGYLEGYITAARIFDHHHNLKSYFVKELNSSLDRPMQWLHEQQAWAAEQVAEHAAAAAGSGDDAEGGFWRLLGLLMLQFDGMVDGYQARAKAAAQAGGDAQAAVGWLSRSELSFLNNNGELYDLIDYFDSPLAVRANNIDPDAHRMGLRLAGQGKCSALIKVTADLGDLLVGHSTWDSYTAALRIYKHYELGLADGVVKARRMSFSSYPGELFSDDDMYILESGLIVVETTNHIYTADVYQPLTPASVLSWQRVRIANMVATNGAEWVRAFSNKNSGTYNNQYMVVDTNCFVPKSELKPGLLWVIEQLPGMVEAADMTEELARGYWPSYNVAYFPQIYEAAGYSSMIAELEAKGAKKYAFSIRWLKYQISPRAAIFRRDQGAIMGLEDLKHTMRYNDWKADPLSYGNPTAAVCSRGDLDQDPTAILKGCYDSKVTSYSLARNLESEVIGGPTTEGQLPFQWSKDPRWAAMEHRGHPDVFNFTWEAMRPKDLPFPSECALGLGLGLGGGASIASRVSAR